MASNRPGSVTIVSALTWLAAISDLLAGAALIWLHYNPEDLGIELASDNLLWYGATTMILGVFTAAVAAGVAMGSQGARVLVMIVMGLRIAGAVYGLAVVGGDIAWQATVQIVLSLVIIAMLSTRRASAWFRGRPTD